jgi:hypothetical protein
MTEELWHQCELRQGTARDVAYIPARAALVGKMVEVVPRSRDFWEVFSVGHPGIPYSRVREVQDRAREGFASTRG